MGLLTTSSCVPGEWTSESVPDESAFREAVDVSLSVLLKDRREVSKQIRSLSQKLYSGHCMSPEVPGSARAALLTDSTDAASTASKARCRAGRAPVL